MTRLLIRRMVMTGLLFLAVTAAGVDTGVKVIETTLIGPFAGIGAELHPENLSPQRIRFHGTDLGWTYEHEGELKILFGDTNASPEVSYIEASTGPRYDDGFGSIDLDKWADPSKIAPDNIPRIKLGQLPGTAEMAALHPGDHAMEGFKTPVGGFSNGRREFAVFYTSKQEGCVTDDGCGTGLTCDTGLGYAGERYDTDVGQTFACLDGAAGCSPDPVNDAAGAPVEGSGLCVDETSTNWAPTPVGRVSAVALTQRVGIRSLNDPRIYTHSKDWLTTKFANPALRTVTRFLPEAGGDRDRQDYRPADGHDAKQRVFLWGRPGFIGVGATGRSLGLYFAYVDMPKGPNFEWTPKYFAGTDADGHPRFSANPAEAAPLDLDSTRPGVQAAEVHDIVDHTSVAWIPTLKKWVMFYGGGITALPNESLPECGILEFFTRSECSEVDIGNGAIRMRMADHPWGPWTPPQDIFVGGDPNARPLEHQYAAGGVLSHPDCTAETCAPHTEDNAPRDYGFLYGANIIPQWIEPAGDGVNIIWNASTWDPYRVVLIRTRIEP